MKSTAMSVLVVALALAAAGPAAAADCGNYGFPRGHQGDNPIFTQKEVFGAGVFDIRTERTRVPRAGWSGFFGPAGGASAIRFAVAAPTAAATAGSATSSFA